MRTIYLISLILLFPSKGKSQTDSIGDKYAGLTLFRLGDPVEKFTNQVTFDYNGTKESGNTNSTLRCRGYYYLPSEQQPVQVGSVKFRYALLVPDRNRNIRTVVFSKSYFENDSLENVESNTEFLLLKKLVEGYLKIKKGKGSSSGMNSKYAIQKKIVWYNDESSYVLSYTEFKKRSPDQKVSAMLSLSYFNYRIPVEADPQMVSLLEYK